MFKFPRLRHLGKNVMPSILARVITTVKYTRFLPAKILLWSISGCDVWAVFVATSSMCGKQA